MEIENIELNKEIEWTTVTLEKITEGHKTEMKEKAEAHKK